MGRGFLEEEDQPGHAQVVVLTDSLWRNRFGADSSIVGKKIRLDGLPHTVVGVLPSWFRFPRSETLGASGVLDVQAEIFKPIAINLKEVSLDGEFNYNVIARSEAWGRRSPGAGGAKRRPGRHCQASFPKSWS